MPNRVAVLLVGNFSEALRQRRVRLANSEPYWLTSEQYAERDGGVYLLPAQAPELVDYARKNSMRPLGVIVVAETGDYSEFMNEDAIAPQDMDFAKRLFESHAHYWFCFLPWIAEQNPQS